MCNFGSLWLLSQFLFISHCTSFEFFPACNSSAVMNSAHLSIFPDHRKIKRRRRGTGELFPNTPRDFVPVPVVVVAVVVIIMASAIAVIEISRRTFFYFLFFKFHSFFWCTHTHSARCLCICTCACTRCARCTTIAFCVVIHLSSSGWLLSQQQQQHQAAKKAFYVLGINVCSSFCLVGPGAPLRVANFLFVASSFMIIIKMLATTNSNKNKKKRSR